MAEYVRVADFEADDAAIDAFVEAIKSEAGPPEGVPAKRINVLTNRQDGKLRVVIFFESEEDLRQGSATLDTMSPPEGAQIRRVGVETFEVLLQRQMG